MSLKILFSNFFGFDGLIFFLAAFNGYVFYQARKKIFALYDTMHQRIYAASDKQEQLDVIKEVDKLSDQLVDSLRESAVAVYSFYETVTGIFPLLGILGTVISLLSMVGATADIQGGFFAALTSTFWGLFFAIIYKLLDGIISPKLEDGERSVELFFARGKKEGEK